MRLTAVTDSLAQRKYSAAERGVRNDSPLPHGINQRVLRHNLLSLFDQVQQNIEDLGFNGNGFAVPAKFKHLGIKIVGAELVNHGQIDPPLIEKR